MTARGSTSCTQLAIIHEVYLPLFMHLVPHVRECELQARLATLITVTITRQIVTDVVNCVTFTE
jgi:hypothetical protein